MSNQNVTVWIPDYKWELDICNSALVIKMVQPPNWFHRVMTTFLLGWRWRKL